jgi:hypothetical protein
MECLLKAADIRYTRPERDPSDPANLDFYIPELRLYIEVKASHADHGRLERQLGKVPIPNRNVMVLMGHTAVEQFVRMIEMCRDVKIDDLYAAPRRTA